MSARVIHILKTYAEAYAQTGKEQPILVIARWVAHSVPLFKIYGNPRADAPTL